MGYALWEILGTVEAGKHFKYYFPLVIFVEIAAYGSLLLYEVSKKNNSNDKHGKDDK